MNTGRTKARTMPVRTASMKSSDYGADSASGAGGGSSCCRTREVSRHQCSSSGQSREPRPREGRRRRGNPNIRDEFEPATGARSSRTYDSVRGSMRVANFQWMVVERFRSPDVDMYSRTFKPNPWWPNIGGAETSMIICVPPWAAITSGIRQCGSLTSTWTTTAPHWIGKDAGTVRWLLCGL